MDHSVDYRPLSSEHERARLAHILEHPEMVGSETAIEDTLGYPEQVVESLFDSEIRLYYRVKQGWRLWPETK